MIGKLVPGVFATRIMIDNKPCIVAVIDSERKFGASLKGGHLRPGKSLSFGEHAPFRPDDWIELETCPICGSPNIEREDYLNPCASAACKLNGVHTYHLGCGSQHRDVYANCRAVLYDSADDEIENAEWEAVEYICSQCERDSIQPGHFACGQTYWIPT